MVGVGMTTSIQALAPALEFRDVQRLSDAYIGGTQLWLSRDGREVILLAVRGTEVCAFPAFNTCRVVNVKADWRLQSVSRPVPHRDHAHDPGYRMSF
jgi:hypothetical protein